MALRRGIRGTGDTPPRGVRGHSQHGTGAAGRRATGRRSDRHRHRARSSARRRDAAADPRGLPHRGAEPAQQLPGRARVPDDDLRRRMGGRCQRHDRRARRPRDPLHRRDHLARRRDARGLPPGRRAVRGARVAHADSAPVQVRAGRRAVAHLERAAWNPHRRGELLAGVPRVHPVLPRPDIPVSRSRRALVFGARLGADEHRAGAARGAGGVARSRREVGVPRGRGAGALGGACRGRSGERVAGRRGVRRCAHGAAHAGAARRQPHRRARHRGGGPHAERRRPERSRGREAADREPPGRSAQCRLRRRDVRPPGDFG